MMTPHCIAIIAPDVYSTAGGIQRYTQTLIAALQRNHPQTKIVVLSKNDAERKGDGVVFFGFDLKKSKAGAARFAISCLRKLLEYKPQQVICTHVNYTPIARLYKKYTGNPFTTVCHGVEVWNRLSSLRRWGIKGATQCWAVSEFTSRKMKKAKNVSSDALRLLPNCIKSESFSEAPKPASLLQKYSLTPELPILLTVNRFEKKETHKAYESLLSAIPIIQKQIPDFRWFAVGAGNDWARFSRKVDRKMLSSKVVLTGYVEDQDLPSFYQLADLFVLPSMLEGFGIVYLEAMACGTFCIGSKRDGSRQALLNGNLGKLVDPNNSREIAHAIIKYFTKKEPHPLAYDSKGLRCEMMKSYSFDQYCFQLNRLTDQLFDA